MPPLVGADKENNQLSTLINYVVTMFLAFLTYIVWQGILSNVINALTLTCFILFIVLQLVGISMMIYHLTNEAAPLLNKNEKAAAHLENIKNYVLLPYFCIVALTLLNGEFSDWIIDLFALTENNSQNQTKLNGIAGVNTRLLTYLIMYSIFIAPIVEEFLFRYVAIGSIVKQSKVWLYARASIAVILFTLIHVSGELSTLWANPSIETFLFFLLAFLTYFIMSSVFTVVYVITGKLRYSIAVHMINNIIASLISFF